MIGVPRILQLSGRTAARRALETGRSRVLMTGAVMAAVFVLIGVRLVDLALLQPGTEPREIRANLSTRGAAGRAEITDRNGIVLAANLATSSLIVDTAHAPGRLLDRLAPILPDLDRSEAARRLASGRRYIVLRRHLTPEEQYEVNRLGVPGVGFRREQRRVYPAGSLTVHVVGFSDPDGRGLAGIERKLDSDLRERSAPLALSLDIRVQHALRRVLSERMALHRAAGAVGLVLEIETGEVLALVSLPDFDPHRPSVASESERFNRATLGVFEMGSTFKIFNTAMALETGAVTLTDAFDATHPIRISRFLIRDFYPQRRVLTIAEIFLHSSNIGSAMMARQVGGGTQREFFRRLGFLAPMGIELGEVGRPLFPRRWSPINTMTISYGYGMAVSALHLAAGAGAMVNGGLLRRPTLLRGGGRVGPPPRRVLSPVTSEKMRRLMRLVVVEGTGKRAAARGYMVGGKTGTAEQVVNSGYDRKKLLSTFVAAFPIHRPRFVILTMLEDPKGTAETHGYATAGWVAAPIVANAVRRIAPLLEVPPVDESSGDLRERMHVDYVRVSKRNGSRAAR